MWQQVAEGNAFDLINLSQYEGQLAEGQRGLLELNLTMPVSVGVAQTLEEQLRNAGVIDVRVTTASPMLRIYFRKGFPWLAVIAAVVLGLIVLAILIIGWRLYKEVFPDGLPAPISAGLIVALAILGLVIWQRRR